MRLFIILVFMLSSTTVFSAERLKQYHVETSIYKNGKRISSPSFMLLEGLPGKVMTSNNDGVEQSFELIASDNSKNSLKGVLLEMQIGNKNEDGSFDEFFPNIVVNNKKRAKIKLVADSGNKYSIYIKAKKVE